MVEPESVSRLSLLALPAELLQHILTYLEPLDLSSVAQTCQPLCTHSCDDQIWQPLVNRNLPSPITEPTPLRSFRDLYVAHHPHWFLPKQTLWFSDSEPSGKLLLSRYDARRGCIEAYAVVARRGEHTIQFWEKDREVIIHSFNPRISLALDQPVLKLDVDSPRTSDHPDNNPSDRAYAPSSQYSKEVLMEMFAEAGLYSSFMLCRTLPKAAIGPQTSIWPPMRFPAETRVRNDSLDGYSSSGHRPTRLDEVSTHAFRLRKWVEYTGRRSSPSLMSFTSPNGLSAALGFNGGPPYFAAGFASTEREGISIKMPEDITTFATLPSSAWTATPAKPWQGLWCGDYSGHGCEFLAILQPDKENERPLPEGLGWLSLWLRGGRRESGRRDSASSGSSYTSAQEEILSHGLHGPREDWHRAETRGESSTSAAVQAERAALAQQAEDAQELAQIVNAQEVLGGFTETPYEGTATGADDGVGVTDYKDVPTGRIEAIKLTGDPNIPRGEYTFIAPDIGHGGFVRVCDEQIFNGARVVRSAGHIAGRGFHEDQWTPSQLIMISHDRLAQFWEGFGHISYYQRVDLEALMRYGLPPRE